MKLTMSALARAEACPVSEHLPRVIDAQQREYRERGVALHAYLASRDLAAVPEAYREEAAAIDLDVLDAVGMWEAELSFALDVGTGAARVLGSNLERNYGELHGDELAGTADLVGLAADAVVILDLKTGSGPLPPPGEALQLLAYAVAASRAYGRSEAYVGWLRLFNDTPVFQWAKLDGFALAVAFQRIGRVVTSVEKATAESTPALGAHCRYCPAKLRCPAQTSLLAALVGGGLKLEEGDLPAVVERLEAAALAVGAARELVNEMAKASPIHLPGGEVYGLVVTTKETLDVEKAREVLKDELPEAFTQEWTASKTSVRDALRAKQPKGITAAMEALEGRLRAAGAMRDTSYSSVKRFFPKSMKAGAK